MDARVDSLLVPSALLRVRQFLSRSGLKVRPWSSPEEALDALSDLLAERRHDTEFWTRLEQLLGDLGRDSRRRRVAEGTVVANEVLDPAKHQALLAEVRAALEDRPTAGFQPLAAGLSRQAFGTLCLVAGVALVGCGGVTQDERRDANEGTGGMGTTGGNGSATTGGGDNDGGNGGAATGGSGGQQTGGNGGVAGLQIIPPPTGGSGGDPATCELGLEEILAACVDDDAYLEDLLLCVADLNDSWQAGVQALLQCESCATVQTHLCQLMETCQDPTLGPEYSLEEFVDHCVVVLYRGVAFE
jgi:hypothetical protein